MKNQNLKGQDRLIVALDVPTHDEAIELVDRLQNVSIFKIGWELFLAGSLYVLLERLQRERPGGSVFVDLKLSGDIGNTITGLVSQGRKLGIRFITLVETVPIATTFQTVAIAKVARGTNGTPEMLMVPCLSSLDIGDLIATGELKEGEDLDDYILKRAEPMVRARCDGLIVSGSAIKVCRDRFGSDLTLVSPGIRPAWSTTDDHKRFTTPTEAIAMGADFLVVGRPISKAANPGEAAQRIIDEIDEVPAECLAPA